MKTKILFAVLAGLSLVISACGVGKQPSYGNPGGTSSPATSAPVIQPTIAPTTAPAIAPTAAPTGEEVKVQIASFAFAPVTLEVKAGTTVTWTNEDGASHIVAADDGSFTSDTLSQGGTFSFTFNKAGTFAYHCDIHGNMKGTITVTQ